MSNTLSHMSTSLPTAGWSSAPIAPESSQPAFGAQGAGRGRVLSASAELQAGTSHDVDGWAGAVTSPLLEEAAA